MIGRTIAHYRILSKLGEGGMGAVYRAEDANLGRQVALKVLSPQLVADPKARKRFLHEAKAAAALDHPGICTVHEAGEAEGHLFIAMALLEGQTLRDRIASGPLSIDESLDIASQVASALKGAHGKGIVHRDIKPANIMLLPSGQAKVMDFGLARLEGATQLTRTGATLGTSAYMSPEQTRGEKVDERADIWSLGVVLYEMVTGRVPFRGEYEPAIEYAILHEEPEPLGTARAGTPPELEKLVGRCLKKNPAERCQSADELLEDLQRLKSKPASARKSMPSRPVPSRPTTVAGSSESAVQILGDRYRIERLLGRGGMGEVWLAFDLKLGVEVALKFLLPEVSSDPQRIALLRREVRTARNVASPHVCRVFDLIEIEGQELVSMEYVDGTTLQELLAAQSPLDIVEARRIATQLLTGLQDIHTAGLIHRDLKPANVMITRSGRAVVMDFGLAKGVADTQTVAVAGTPAYMAPEQMRGEELDSRADLYAVGMILAEMVAPEGVRDTALRRKLWDGLRQDPPKAPSGPWESAIRRAVAANRGERFAAAAELARALGDGGQRLSGIEEVSPYPGLSAFTGEQTRFFFGRELDVESMWRKISRLPLAALIGPSGVGKSSFLRAGVIAAKPDGWNVVICTPGNAPFTSLGRSLLPEFVGQTEAMQDLFGLQDIDRSIPLLNKWRQRGKQALLVVDQFEELFTLNPPEVQSRFAELLGRLPIEADIHVLVSMRDDFFFLCQQYPALRPLFTASMPLGPLSQKDLRRAIVEPARLCGFAFEDDALVDEMMSEVEGERGALPLVAFAAARLWELRDREHGVITRRSYEEIGRVGGALAQHAEATLEKIGHEREDIVREIFRNLVTAQHTRVVRERDELLSVFENRAVAEDVLKALIDARLLTSFEIPEARDGSKERRRIEVVHESLLTSWPRLVRWQTQDIEGAQLRDQIRQAAQLWKEKSESDDLLWTGTAYREFEFWRERYPGGLTDTEDAFARAMIARAGRQRRRRRIALGSAFALLIAVVAVIGWSWRGERLARLEAEASKLVALGRNELAENPSAALAYAIASLERADTPANRRYALESLYRGPMALAMPIPSDFDVTNMHFSPDGKKLVAGGTSGVRVFSVDGSPPVVLEKFSPERVVGREPQFAPDGDRVIFRSGEDRNLVHVWSLSQGKVVRTFKIEGYTVPFVRGEKVVFLTFVAGWIAEMRTWAFDESEPRLLSRWNYKGISHGSLMLDIDPSGELVAFPKGHGIYVCPIENLGSGRARLIGEHASEATAVAFDPTGKLVASGDTLGEVLIWSLAGDSGAPIRELHGEESIDGLVFDPSGRMLVAIGAPPKKNILLWDLSVPFDAAPVVYRARRGNQDLRDVAIDPSGRWIVAGYEGNIVFMPLAPPNPYVLRGWAGVFTPDGKRFITSSGSSTNTIRVVDLTSGATRDIWKTSGGGFTQVAPDPTGEFFAVATNYDGTMLISLKDGKARQLPDDPPNGSIMTVAMSLDGRFAAGSRGGGIAEDMIRVWDLAADSVWVLKNSKGGEYFYWLKFAEDGSLFTCSSQGIVQRWNILDGSSTIIGKSDLPYASDLAVSRNARFLFANFISNYQWGATTIGEVTKFDLQNHTSFPLKSHGNRVAGVALDPTEKLVITAGLDGAVRVGPVTGEEPHMLLAPDGSYTVSISPDGKWIATSSAGVPAVRIWRMPEGRPIHTLPREELLNLLRAQTNVRVIADPASQTGYRLDTAPFPGWEKTPQWQ